MLVDATRAKRLVIVLAACAIIVASVANFFLYSIAFTAASTSPWLTIVSPAGNTAPGTLTVTANPAGLGAGSYTGAITLTPTGAGGITRSNSGSPHARRADAPPSNGNS